MTLDPSADPSAIERAVEQLIAASCLALDEERFEDFLALCTDGFRYAIEAHSAEIDKDMTWLAVDRDGLAGLFSSLPRHVRFEGQLMRQPGMPVIRPDADRIGVHAATPVMIHQTDLDGETRLLAVCRYHDHWSADRDTPLLRERRVRLHTRVFETEAGGSHVPL